MACWNTISTSLCNAWTIEAVARFVCFACPQLPPTSLVWLELSSGCSMSGYPLTAPVCMLWFRHANNGIIVVCQPLAGQFTLLLCRTSTGQKTALKGSELNQLSVSGLAGSGWMIRDACVWQGDETLWNLLGALWGIKQIMSTAEKDHRAASYYSLLQIVDTVRMWF